MTLDQDLNEELRLAERESAKNFRSRQAQIPNAGGMAGSKAAFMMAEESARVIEAYQSVFEEKGIEFTQGYLAGREMRLSNAFSKPYKAAKRALEEMESYKSSTSS